MHAPDQLVHGQIFNVASGQHRAILDVAQDVLRLMGANANRITHMGDRPGQVERHTGDLSKINRVLRWEPRVDWEEGLRRTIEWFAGNREQWEKQIWMGSIPVTFADGHTEYH